ncbi:MAG: MaoC family dehydratase N-terminal domain-containing protein [Deltaproteobacteria bacterium]|nr:MaoC family dehydratase N-terminal domain-containing protein [Deltaproteobacteria bacterium]
MSKELIGWERPPFTITIDKVKVQEYVHALQDDNPVFRDEQAAKAEGYEGTLVPLGLIQTITAYDTAGLLSKLNIAFEQVLAGDLEWEFYRLIQAGEPITGQTRVVDVYEKQGRQGKMTFFIMETVYTNQRGEKVMRDKVTLIRRDDVVGGEKPAST